MTHPITAANQLELHSLFDRAAAWLAAMNDDQRTRWLTYLLKAIEEEHEANNYASDPVDWLHYLVVAIEARQQNGVWR